MIIKSTIIEFRGTGRRKTAVARVRLTEGAGPRTINGRELDDYFPGDMLAHTALAPLATVEMKDGFHFNAIVAGGGVHAQASAVSLGIARALLRYNAGLRAPLKKAGLLTRDQREKERKKSGRPGARKRFQFSKR